MTATAGRFPLVSRDEILLAYRPGAEPSEGAFRTLRRRKLVSHGIGLRVRHKNRLAGQVRVYSILNLDCAVLARRGKIEQARRIASRAGRQEARWEPRLEKLLSSIGAETFEKLQQLRKEFAHAFLPLAQEAERSRASFSTLNKWLVERLGELTEVTDTWASLRLFTPTQEIIEVQRSLVDAVALSLGELAILRIERLQGASLVGIVPAVGEADRSAIERTNEAGEVSAYLTRLLEPVAVDARVVAELKARRDGDNTVELPQRRIRLAG